MRDKLAAEINKLSSRGVSLPFPQLGFRPWTPLNLPPDPTYAAESSSVRRADKKLNEIEDLPPRKVCIIGAGMAGLYIAMILDDLKIPNVTYDILESSSRIGGRVYTHRFSQEPNDYYDVGAMRYPKIPIMSRAFRLFESTNMSLVDFNMTRNTNCPSLFNGRFFVPGVSDPFEVGVKNRGNVPDHVVDNVDGILDKAFTPFKKELTRDFEAGFNKLMSVDELSTREFLKRGGLEGKEQPYDFFAIQWMETLTTATNLFDQGFSESVLDSFIFETSKEDIKWYSIRGGTSRLADAMAQSLSKNVQTDKRVEAISIDMESKNDGNMSVRCAKEATPREGYSTVFNTTSLGCLARMDLHSLRLHPSVKDAIRSLHYDNSAKIALKFRYPWWIVDCGIRNGGIAKTDLPLGTCVYPSYNDGLNKPATLLASYTWAQDAIRISSLIDNEPQPPSEGELVELILHNLAQLHSQRGITYEHLKSTYMGVHHAYSWTHDPNTTGAFALFSPGQFSNLLPYLQRPAADGKFHIVGEASSAHHGWIVGALDSAYLAVYQFLRLYDLRKYMFILQRRWGTVDELETGEYGTVHLQIALGRLPPEQQVKVGHFDNKL